LFLFSFKNTFYSQFIPIKAIIFLNFLNYFLKNFIFNFQLLRNVLHKLSTVSLFPAGLSINEIYLTAG